MVVLVFMNTELAAMSILATELCNIAPLSCSSCFETTSSVDDDDLSVTEVAAVVAVNGLTEISVPNRLNTIVVEGFVLLVDNDADACLVTSSAAMLQLLGIVFIAISAPNNLNIFIIARAGVIYVAIS